MITLALRSLSRDIITQEKMCREHREFTNSLDTNSDYYKENQDILNDYEAGLNNLFRCKNFFELMKIQVKNMDDFPPLLEKIAGLEHQQWAHWTKHMLDTIEVLLGYPLEDIDHPNNRTEEQEKARKSIIRWKKQIETPYSHLGEIEKDSDRKWAKKALDILSSELPRPNKKSGSTKRVLHNSNVSEAKDNVDDLIVVGNPNNFQLLSKASSESQGFMKSTKAMELQNGCLVQVTTRETNPDGSCSVAEALQFVPDVQIEEDINDGCKLVYNSFRDEKIFDHFTKFRVMYQNVHGDKK